MAENRVAIDGGSSTTLPTSPTNLSTAPLFTAISPNPAIKGAYVFSLGGLAGQNTAYNFLSLFNPVGSGKVISVGAGYVSSYANGANAATVPMNLFRTTAASAGTLQTNSTAVAKFQTSQPTSIAEVRTGNPTVTTGAQLANIAPAEGSFSTDQFIQAAPSVYPPFTLAEGEGVCYRQTAAGTTSMFWNFSIVWAEL